MAPCFVHQVALLFAPDGVPLCLTDGHQDFCTATSVSVNGPKSSQLFSKSFSAPRACCSRLDSARSRSPPQRGGRDRRGDRSLAQGLGQNLRRYRSERAGLDRADRLW
jgi:hypothetical protein